MTFANEGGTDRAVRMLAGMAFATAGLLASGAAAVLLVAVGGIALVTGIAGWCPVYTLIGISTRKGRPVAHCPNCEHHA